MILGVDPGLRCTGWALRGSDALFDFGVIRPPTRATLDEKIYHVICSLPHRERVSKVIVERMWSRGARGLGSPQGLLDLQLLAGAVGGAYPRRLWATPQEWKGTLPVYTLYKRLCNDPRLSLAQRERLIELEGGPKAPGLDAAAAIGLCFWAPLS